MQATDRGPIEMQIGAVLFPVKNLSRIISLVVAGAVVVTLCFVLMPHEGEVTYKGKSVSRWFYGKRSDFFTQSQMDEANRAFKALGTNALPFLFSNLSKHESPFGSLYFSLYRFLPRPIQPLIPYPISVDDIQSITLEHLRKMGPMPREWYTALAGQVPRLPNPGVRVVGLHVLYGSTYPIRDQRLITNLCRDLLQDGHFGIRLEAARKLAELEPSDTSGLSVLLEALEDSRTLKEALSIYHYTFQQPPGGSAKAVPVVPTRRFPDQLRMWQSTVVDAVERLEPHLSLEQKRKVLQSAIKALAKGNESASRLVSSVKRTSGSVFILVRLLTCEDPRVRACSAKVLGELGSATHEAIPALRERLQDEEIEVRRQAAEALLSIDSESAAKGGVQ